MNRVAGRGLLLIFKLAPLQITLLHVLYHIYVRSAFGDFHSEKILFKSIHAHAKDENITKPKKREKKKNNERVHSHTNKQSVSVRNVHFMVSSRFWHCQTEYYYCSHSMACMGYFSVVVFAVAATFAKCSVYIVFVRVRKLRARKSNVSLGEGMRKQVKCTKRTTTTTKNTRDTPSKIPSTMLMLANVARFLWCSPFVCLHFPFIS